MSIKNVGSNQFWSPLGPKRIGIQKLLAQKNIETNVTRTNKNSGPKKAWIQKTLGPKKFSVHKISGQKESLGQLSPGEMLHAQMSLIFGS